jgi:hypothetical protein
MFRLNRFVAACGAMIVASSLTTWVVTTGAVMAIGAAVSFAGKTGKTLLKKALRLDPSTFGNPFLVCILYLH